MKKISLNFTSEFKAEVILLTLEIFSIQCKIVLYVVLITGILTMSLHQKTIDIYFKTGVAKLQHDKSKTASYKFRYIQRQ